MSNKNKESKLRRSNLIPCNIEIPDNFYNKQFRALPISAQKKLSSIMDIMIYYENPIELGIWKNTKYGPAYLTNLNDSYRLAYMVDVGTRTIKILRVGDHKAVYGKG